MVYVGGKKKIHKDIVNILQTEINHNSYESYIEPFVGGANIIEHIKDINKIGYDINEELIEFWKALQNGWQMPKPNSFNAEHYNEVKISYKRQDNKYPKYYYGYMMTVPSYNGRIWGSFAKDGKRPYQKEHYDNVLQQINGIKDVLFDVKDYKNIKVSNCILYCDPPYKDSKKDYYNCNFNSNDFWDWAYEISKNNKIYISETKAPEFAKIVWSQPYKRTLANQTKSIDTIEKLYTI